jgi:hypothetical protein
MRGGENEGVNGASEKTMREITVSLQTMYLV